MSQRFQSAKRFGMANGGLVLEVLKESLSDTRDVGLVKMPVAEIATDQFWKSDPARASVRKVGWQFSAVCGDLRHHLLVQPDIH